ncbi:MAG: SufS family cysteine desulfurase [Terriglobales bacterium]
MSTAPDIVNHQALAPGHATFDVERIRADFPALQQLVHGHPLVYLDNAATTQKPRQVVHAVEQFYCENCANIHRGVHLLSERATECYECSRGKVQRFLNARESAEIIFVRGATEGINLVAHSFGRQFISAGDEIIISAMEHHSDIVPWQILCELTGARLRVIPITDDGELRLDEYAKLLGPKTKIVSVVHISNALGTVNPVRKIIEMAHVWNVPVLIDGAQSIPHQPVDVQELGADFFVFSGHKIYGPTGVGVLYGRREWLDRMPPYQGGGDMISSVTFERTTYNKLPYKFEAGTPNISGVIGLGAALDYVESIGREAIAAYERDLLDYATQRVSAIPGVRLIGAAREKAGVISFLIDDVHPHDIGTILDQQGIAIRAGHHCAQPVMQRFGIPATARASIAFYNTREEIDRLVAGIENVREVFA